MPPLPTNRPDHNLPEKGMDPRFEDWITGIGVALRCAQARLAEGQPGESSFVIPKAVLEMKVRINAVQRTEKHGGVNLIVWSNKGSNTKTSEEEFTSTVRLEFVNVAQTLNTRI